MYVAVVFAWIYGFASYMAVPFETSVVIDDVCYWLAVWKKPELKLFVIFYYFIFTYVTVLLTSVFCYGKILMNIRRQARVMASHNPAGSSTAQSQSNKIQKTSSKR